MELFKILTPEQKAMVERIVDFWQQEQEERNPANTFYEAWLTKDYDKVTRTAIQKAYSAETPSPFSGAPIGKSDKKIKQAIKNDARIASFKLGDTFILLLQKKGESAKDFNNRCQTFEKLFNQVSTDISIQAQFIVNAKRSSDTSIAHSDEEFIDSLKGYLSGYRLRTFTAKQIYQEIVKQNLVIVKPRVLTSINMRKLPGSYAQNLPNAGVTLKSVAGVGGGTMLVPVLPTPSAGKNYVFLAQSKFYEKDMEEYLEEFRQSHKETAFKARMEEFVFNNLRIHPDVLAAHENLNQAQERYRKVQEDVEKELREKGAELLRNEDGLNL